MQTVENHTQDQSNDLGNNLCIKCGTKYVSTYLEIDGYEPYQDVKMTNPVTKRYLTLLLCPKCEV
jgi:hypothetical protein